MNGRLPFLDHASDLLLQLYPICLVLLFPHELIKRPLLIALHVPGHDHLRRACGLGHCVMAAPVPLRSFFSSATSFTRRSAPLITVARKPGTREPRCERKGFRSPAARRPPLPLKIFCLCLTLPQERAPPTLSSEIRQGGPARERESIPSVGGVRLSGVQRSLESFRKPGTRGKHGVRRSGPPQETAARDSRRKFYFLSQIVVCASQQPFTGALPTNNEPALPEVKCRFNQSACAGLRRALQISAESPRLPRSLPTASQPNFSQGGGPPRLYCLALFFLRTDREKNAPRGCPGTLRPTSRTVPYGVRGPPHRRWVQETQPHTCGCAERILTAEF